MRTGPTPRQCSRWSRKRTTRASHALPSRALLTQSPTSGSSSAWSRHYVAWLLTQPVQPAIHWLVPGHVLLLPLWHHTGRKPSSGTPAPLPVFPVLSGYQLVESLHLLPGASPNSPTLPSGSARPLLSVPPAPHFDVLPPQPSSHGGHRDWVVQSSSSPLSSL